MKLAHGRVSIELHPLRQGGGDVLLLLHELGGSAGGWGEGWQSWPGAVYALDFAGHGASGRVRGGGYYPEYFVADADLALEALDDRALVVGAGVGAYVAMLLAGARPDRIPCAALLPGRGLEGGGDRPDFEQPVRMSGRAWEARLAERANVYAPGTDPMVAMCEQDLRPTDYAADFAEAASALLFSDLAAPGPPWWRAARERSGGETAGDGLEAVVSRLREAIG